jgi:predicted kinase
MLGLPGAGKTTYSKQLADTLHLTRLSLDEEYANLGGDLNSHRWDELISSQANAHIKTRLSELVGMSQSAVLDFCPWKREERAQYITFLESLGADVQMYYFDIPLAELNRRLTTRNNNSTNKAHHVTPEMLAAFAKRFDPPTVEHHQRITIEE